MQSLHAFFAKSAVRAAESLICSSADLHEFFAQQSRQGPFPRPGASRLDVGDPFEAILELDDEAIAHRTIGIHDLLA